MRVAQAKHNRPRFGGSFIRFCTIGIWVLAGLAACKPGIAVDTFVRIPDRAWDYDFKPEVSLHVRDQGQAYKVFINLRHTQQYAFSNIFLLVHRHNPSGEVETGRIELTLALPDGRWTGKGSGNLYTHQYLLSDHYVFPDTGTFKLTLEQNMRENPLQHVAEAGFRIDPVE